LVVHETAAAAQREKAALSSPERSITSRGDAPVVGANEAEPSGIFGRRK